MVAVRAAYILTERSAWIVVPLNSQFGECSDGEKKQIFACCESEARAVRRMPMLGTVVIAWLNGGRLELTTPPWFRGSLPQITWLSLLARLHHKIYCDDAVVGQLLTTRTSRSWRSQNPRLHRPGDCERVAH